MVPPAAPLATVAALPLLQLDWFASERVVEDEARRVLAQSTFKPAPEQLAAHPTLDRVAVVNEHQDGQPIHVPKVDVDLGETEAPDVDAAYRIAAAVVRALHPVFEGKHVRHYDVEFAFRAPSLSEPRQRRRIAVTSVLADGLVRNPDADAAALRDAIEERDGGDDELPPVAWGDPLPDSYYRDASDRGPVRRALLGA